GPHRLFRALARGQSESSPGQFPEGSRRALSLAVRRRLTSASEFGERAICRYEFFQHGCDELGWIDGVLSGFARKRPGVGDKIAMQRRGQVECHPDRLVVFDRAELQLRHVNTSSLKRRVRARDRGSPSLERGTPA